MRIAFAAVAFAALLAGATASIDECLKKDSISCLQQQIFRSAREFFDQPSIEVFGGLNFVKTQDASGARSATLQAELAQEKLEKARSVEEKELTLENYIGEEARNFFEKRNLQWNMATLARNVADAAPESLKQLATDLLSEEGRGRRKKVMRVLLPFLMGLKVKFATVLGMAYVGLMFLAKKAILLSLISIAISIFLLAKKMMHPGHEELYPYSHGPPVGWQSHSDSGHIEYAAHSAPIPQHLAYSAHKPARR